MPLFRVTFTEQGGYRVSCRIRAAAGAEHVDRAVQKVWGEDAVWVPEPGTRTGRVCRPARYAGDPPLIPLTGPMTVQVVRAMRRGVLHERE